MYEHCLLCGVKLRTQESKQRGTCPSCYELIKHNDKYSSHGHNFINFRTGKLNHKMILSVRRCYNCVYFKPFRRKIMKLKVKQKYNDEHVFPGYCTKKTDIKRSINIPEQFYRNGFVTGCSAFVNKYKYVKMGLKSFSKNINKKVKLVVEEVINLFDNS